MIASSEAASAAWRAAAMNHYTEQSAEIERIINGPGTAKAKAELHALLLAELGPDAPKPEPDAKGFPPELRSAWHTAQAKGAELRESAANGAAPDALKALRSERDALLTGLAAELGAWVPDEPLAFRNRWDTGAKPPKREWLVPEWIPAGRAGLLAGQGGGGKSLLAVQLGCALAAGTGANEATGRQGEPWLPSAECEYPARTVPYVGCPEPVDVVFASWEDEPDECQRRMHYMAGKPRFGFANSARTGERFHWVDMRTRGPLWGPPEPKSGASTHDRNRGALLPAGAKLRAYCEAVGARLLVIDPLAAAFANDENARALVRAFMADWDAWAQASGCTVLILAHPPKGSDSAYSGSTDWEGAARFLISFGRERIGDKPSGGTDNRPWGMRLLLVKANYARAGRAAWLRLVGKADAWEQCVEGQAAIDESEPPAPDESEPKSGLTAAQRAAIEECSG